MGDFEVVAPWAPAGDQPGAIEALSVALSAGARRVCLEGITGSGKSATVAWTIERIKKPTLVIAPNKSLAAQLAAELGGLLPNNAVEYFVSYYDYYRPEAYLPTSDTYIEKDSAINEEIDRLRHRTTAALLSREDVVVVASVSCIYGLGSPEAYKAMTWWTEPGARGDIRDFAKRLVEMGYSRNETVLERGTFRMRGDILDVWGVGEEEALRIEMFGDEVTSIRNLEPLKGELGRDLDRGFVFSTSHHVADAESIARAGQTIRAELEETLAIFRANDCLLEAQRLEQRVEQDLEMLEETGMCRGVENYSRHFDGRETGEAPSTLLDYFGDDFLVVLDESHVSLSQIGGQVLGDRSRKETLVEHGFRLPSCLDNRPLTKEEFLDKANQILFVSATPGDAELAMSELVVEQIVRPTGLVDPLIEVRESLGQVENLLAEVVAAVEADERVLVVTLTKKMAEDLTEYLQGRGVRARWLHADVTTLERIELFEQLREGSYDVLVGINLLREGIDLPEVGLVAILDADKEGFLRSKTSLIQIIGRAARNANGRVIMYADRVSSAMEGAIEVTNARRARQEAYNTEHGIVPRSVEKELRKALAGREDEIDVEGGDVEGGEGELSAEMLEFEMLAAAGRQDYEEAARLRDKLNKVLAKANRKRG